MVDQGKYPDFDRVIPKGKMLEFDPAGIVVDMGPYKDQVLCTFAGMAVDRKYLQPVLDWMPGAPIQYTDKTSSVKLEQGEYLAVIMPVRV